MRSVRLALWEQSDIQSMNDFEPTPLCVVKRRRALLATYMFREDKDETSWLNWYDCRRSHRTGELGGYERRRSREETGIHDGESRQAGRFWLPAQRHRERDNQARRTCRSHGGKGERSSGQHRLRFLRDPEAGRTV